MRFLGCAATIAAMLTGCHSANPLVGKWRADLSKYGLPDTTREFRADGTETIFDGGNSAPKEMTYTVNGNVLTETEIVPPDAVTRTGDVTTITTSIPPDTTKSTFTISGNKLTINHPWLKHITIHRTYNRVP